MAIYADIVAGVTYCGAGRFHHVFQLGVVGKLGNIFTGDLHIVAIPANVVAGVAFLGAGGICLILQLRFVGKHGDDFAGFRDLITTGTSPVAGIALLYASGFFDPQQFLVAVETAGGRNGLNR